MYKYLFIIILCIRTGAVKFWVDKFNTFDFQHANLLLNAKNRTKILKSHLFLTGCPQQWKNFREKCYYFSSGAERLSFEETHDLCKNKSSSMLIINDNAEQVQNEKSYV